MRKSKIKEKLLRNEPALITTLHFTDPSLYELTSLMGFDGIWVDMEHHSTSVETSSNLMRAARVGSSDIVARPAKGEFMRMCRMLEMGAQAIMYPRCSSAEEAAEVVKWAKFYPQGQRGVDSGNADGWYCGAPLTQYLEFANEQTLGEPFGLVRAYASTWGPPNSRVRNWLGDHKYVLWSVKPPHDVNGDDDWTPVATGLAGGLVDAMVTPTGLAAIMEGRKVWERAGNVPPPSRGGTSAASEPVPAPRLRFESFSRASATVSLDDGDELVLVLTRRGLEWRLSDIRLPPA